MKAVRLHAYREPPTVDEVTEPEITGPHDVIVRLGGAGLCRTDLHMRDGWLADMVPVDLPLTLGHETAGWVHAVGSAVEHVAAGDTVICHPNISCGTCAACQAGQTMRCVKGLDFPGITRDGGFAELVKTAARAVLPLDPGSSRPTWPRWPTGAWPPTTRSASSCRSWSRGAGSW